MRFASSRGERLGAYLDKRTIGAGNRPGGVPKIQLLVAYATRLTPARPATCRSTYVNRIESRVLIKRVLGGKTVPHDPVDRGLVATALVAALTAFLICCQLP